MRALAVFVLVAVAAATTAHAQLAATCDVVVHFPENVPVDWFGVRVGVYDASGTSLQDEVDALPPSQLFLVPLYERGTYILRVHAAPTLAFDPPELVVSDTTCTRPWTFTYVGRDVDGRVVGDGDVGVHDVTVLLVQRDPIDFSETVVQTTHSDANGRFVFNRVLPGVYLARPTHARYAFNVDSELVIVGINLVEGPATMRVAGFVVAGAVWHEGHPVANVNVHLIAHGQDASKAVCMPSLPAIVPFKATTAHQPTFQCSARTGPDGTYTFARVSDGTYEVYADYALDGRHFTITPDRHLIHVTTSSSSTVPPFEVGGFSVVGRIVHGDKTTGVADADVSTSTTKRTAKSGPDGTYMFIDVQGGKEIITITATDIQFEPTEMTISASEARLPDIVAKQYLVSGRIASTAMGPRSILIKGVDGTTFPQKTLFTQGSDNVFSFWAPVGTYLIQPIMNEDDVAAGLALYPPEIKVAALNKPVHDLQFSQTLSSVSGNVHCLQKPCRIRFQVQLIHATRGVLQTETINDDDTFLFEDVTPGEYTISLTPSDTFCFEQTPIPVTVPPSPPGQGPSAHVEFKQTGFRIRTHSTHAIKLTYKHNSLPEKGTLQIPHGDYNFCVSAPGLYSLVPYGCFTFAFGAPGQNEYLFNTNNPRLVNISVDMFGLHGTVSTESIAEQMSLEADTPWDKDSPVETHHLTKYTEEQGRFLYSYWVFGKVGQTVNIRFMHEQLVFYPPVLSSTIVYSDSCLAPQPLVTARKGLFISGKITPPIEGAAVIVYQASQNWTKTCVTDSSGTYHTGPLYSDAEFVVTVSKPGCGFTPTGPTDFDAEIFGQIKINVKTGAYYDENVEGAVMLLTGPDNFRASNLTGLDGSLIYWDLRPGQYYLKPLMKEYRFDPVAMHLEIKRGHMEEVRIGATRLTFRASGQVTTINGDGLADVAIHAVSSDSAHREFAMTDTQGKFKIRGLKPNTTYIVQVAPSKQIRQTIPLDGHAVDIGEQDVSELNMVVISKPSLISISGRFVHTEPVPETLSGLRVELHRATQPGTSIATFDLGAAPFFEFRDVTAEADYFVTVKSTGRGHIRLRSEQPRFSVSAADWTIEIPLEAVLVPSPLSSPSSAAGASTDFSEADDVDYSAASGSLLFLFVLGVLGYAALNFNQTARWIAQMQARFQRGHIGIASNSAAKAGDKSDFLPQELRAKANQGTRKPSGRS